MKPQTIIGTSLTLNQQTQIMKWLKTNGVRHYIPEDARIVITGNWIITPTFDIGRTYNPRYNYNHKAGTLKVKVRRYRIRHELKFDGDA